MLKSIKRYPLASVVLLAGIILSMLCLFHATSITKTLKLEEMDAKNGFEYSRTVYVDGQDIPKELLDYLEACEGNITITDIDICVGVDKRFRLGNLVMKQEEVPKEILVEGEYPVEEKGYNNKIILGNSYIDEVRGTGDASFMINGEQCYVSGFIKSPNSVNRSYDVNMYYFACSDEMKNILLQTMRQYGITILFETDRADIFVDYSNYEENIRAILSGSGCNVSVQDNNDNARFFASETYEGYQSSAYLSYIYSLVLILITTEFWLVCRRKEMITRKIYGYSDFRILCTMIKDILMYSFMAFVIVLPLEIIFSICTDKLLIFNKYTFITQIITIIVFILILVIFAAVYLGVKLKKSGIYNMLSKRGGVE